MKYSSCTTLVDGLLTALKEEQGLITLDSRHRYKRQKEYKVGVSTVSKVLDSPELDAWKVRVQVEGTARVAYQNRPGFGETEECYVKRLLELSRQQYEHERISLEAAAIGKQVHLLIEEAIKAMLGNPIPKPQVSEESRYVFSGWSEWVRSSGFRPLASEVRVYHREDDYCGTVDCIGVVNDELAVIDWKPKSSLYPSQRLQLAGYAGALKSMGWPEMTRAIVSMPRDGGEIRYVPIESDLWADYEAFSSCLFLYRRTRVWSQNANPSFLRGVQGRKATDRGRNSLEGHPHTG